MIPTLKYNILRLRQVAILFLLALGICGCVKEDSRIIGFPTESEEVYVKFEINIPGADIPQTRSITATEEDAVKSIDILAFDGDDFLYRVEPVQINTQGGGAHVFTVKLKKSNTDVRFVFLANATEIITAAYSGGEIPVGETYADVQGKLIKSSQVKWNAAATDDYTPIPMWGERAFPVTGSNIVVPTIDLHRMLARINVTVNSDDFVLREVILYQPMKQGYLIPKSGSWGLSEDKAESPSLGTGTDWERLDYSSLWDFTYTDITNPSQGIYECVNQIYTFEAAPGLGLQQSDKYTTTIIIRGLYKGQDCYYGMHIAVKKDDGQFEYLPLLRNHTYNFLVNSINHPGYSEPAEAAHLPSNIGATLIVENDFDYKCYAWDEYYYLAVEDKKKEVDWRADSYSMKVKNNYGPWNAVVSSDTDDPTATNPGWITFGTLNTPTGNGEKGKTTIEFNVAENTTDAQREAYIHISTGSLSLVVTVMQDKQEISWELPSGRILAREDARLNGNSGDEKMTWAEAMGIPTSFNNEWYNLSDWNNTMYIPSENTGCGAYSEPGYPAGTWRLPTSAELYVVKENQQAYGMEPNEVYWSSQEAAGVEEHLPMSSVVYMHMNSYYPWARPAKAKVRCVYDPNGVTVNPPLPGEPVVLTSGRIVADYDVDDDNLNWARAMGIHPNQFNDIFYYYSSFEEDINNRNYIPTQLTGCGGYFQDSPDHHKTGTGRWRLPTQAEVLEMRDFADKINNTTDGFYWTSTETTNQFDVAIFETAFTDAKDYTPYASKMDIGMRARCVRDPDPAPLPENYRLRSGHFVARDDCLDKMTWAEAMGISPGYNSTHFYTTYGGTLQNTNYTPEAGISTGCAGYSESAADKGKWRLPTKIEMMEIDQDLFMEYTEPMGIWWSSEEENSRPQNATVIHKSDMTSSYSKTGLYWVRCVRKED